MQDASPDRPIARDALSPDELKKTDAYWRAANYLSVGQIYLLGNPLLHEGKAKFADPQKSLLKLIDAKRRSWRISAAP